MLIVQIGIHGRFALRVHRGRTAKRQRENHGRFLSNKNHIVRIQNDNNYRLLFKSQKTIILDL